MTLIVNDSSQNPIHLSNIKVGVARLDISPFGSSAEWNQEEGWLPLGLINPGSLRYDFPKEIFPVPSGSPSTIKKQFIVGHSGRVELSLEEIDARGRELALGHDAGTVTEIKEDSLGDLEAASKGDTEIVFDTANPLVVPEKGDELVLTLTDPDLGGTREVFVRVAAFDAASRTVTLEAPLEIDVTALDTAAVVDYRRIMIGGNFLKDYRARTIISCTDGSMQVLELFKVNVTAGFTPDLRDGKQTILLPLTLEALGVTKMENNRKQVALGYWYEIPKVA